MPALPASSFAERDPYQPPLRWYSHLWRYALAVLLSIGGVGTALLSGERLGAVSALGAQRFWAIQVGLALAAFVLTFWRRRWPMAIAVTLTLTSILSPLAGGAATLAVVSLATGRRWWQVITIGVLNVVAALAQYWLSGLANSAPFWLVLVFTVISVAAGLAIGMYLGSRRELVWTLRQRAENAEAEQAARAREARVTERSRIAREMHDVLAHRISQISLHAGALTFRDDLTADQLRECFVVIQAKAHEALIDLRGVLGVLRDETHRGSSEYTLTHTPRPQPTFDDIPELIADAQLVGLVEYDNRLSEKPPEYVGRAVYRIVQEGITNAHKHAPQAKLALTVTGSPGEGIALAMSNPLGFGQTNTPGAGLGLIGLSERAEQLGGRLTSTSEAGEFRLTAWLPWEGEREAEVASR